jgi:glycosyltransferase involved in cell wall biosynthesis
MKKISIIHSCNSLGISEGGPPRSITQLCSPLSSLNANVTIQVFKGEQEEVLPDPAVSILRSTVEDLSGFRQKILEDREAIIIHQHGLWLPSAHAVTGVANKNDVPLVLAPRGMMEAWAMKSKRWKKFIAWWLYQRRDCRFVRAFHATSDLEADSIRRLGMKQPIIILPNGVVPPPASPEDPKACEAPKQKKTVLFLSRINPKKGLPMLLEAWAKLRPADW